MRDYQRKNARTENREIKKGKIRYNQRGNVRNGNKKEKEYKCDKIDDQRANMRKGNEKEGEIKQEKMG